MYRDHGPSGVQNTWILYVLPSQQAATIHAAMNNLSLIHKSHSSYNLVLTLEGASDHVATQIFLVSKTSYPIILFLICDPWAQIKLLVCVCACMCIHVCVRQVTKGESASHQFSLVLTKSSHISLFNITIFDFSVPWILKCHNEKKLSFSQPVIKYLHSSIFHMLQ